jgi:hypothetical protein
MNKIHERGYWLVKEDYYTHNCDSPLCDAIIALFKDKISNAIDVGCGDGAYTKKFIDAGVNCMGYDGSPLTPQNSSGLCKVVDFSTPVNLGKYDLVLSLEVGEHIPVKYEQNFINNLTNLSRKYIVLSWAVDGQPGIGHFNCRNNDYVITEITKRGFSLVTEDTALLREASTFPWFANTLMVFIKL